MTPPALALTRASWRVLTLPVLTAVLLGLTIALDVATPGGRLGTRLAPGAAWPFALLGLLYAAFAAVVLLHDVAQRVGWALSWLGMFWVLDGLAQGYVRWGVRTDAAQPGSNLALWFLNRFGAYLPVTVALLLFLFPTGRFLDGRWGVTGRVVTVVMTAAATCAVVGPAPDGFDDVRLPPGVDLDRGSIPFPGGIGSLLLPVAIALSAAGAVVAMASVVVRYRRSRGAERDTMRWLLWAVVVMALDLVVTGITGFDPGGWFSITSLAALPALAMTVGIVRPGVVPVEELVGATVVYGLLWVGLLVVDLAAVLGLATLLGDSLTQRQTVLVALLLSAGVYAPLRQRLAVAARRAVLGSRARRYDAVAGLASRLETTDEGEEQLAAVAQAVAEAFRVRFVSVEVDRDAGERLVATYGTLPERTRTLPISYRDEPVGRLVLPAGGLRGRLSRRDEQLLADLVRQAATAARTSRLAGELQRNRERLVVAREEERRRIRRDLHDGLGPALGGAVFGLESVRLQLERDPAAAREQLTTIRDQLQEIVADVRRLVHDLRPPALDDRGLVAALRQQAERLSASGPAITVQASGVAALPAAVEVAAYRIVGEAMTNVVRHAGAARCDVRLHVEAGDLRIEVVDDGAGIAADAEAGVGLVSLRERAAELGGVTSVTCPHGGGTVVQARLPLDSGRPVGRSTPT